MRIGEYKTMMHGVTKHVQHLAGQPLCNKAWRIIKRIQFYKKNPTLIERLRLVCQKNWKQKQNCTISSSKCQNQDAKVFIQQPTLP